MDLLFRYVPKDIPGRGGKTVYFIQARKRINQKWNYYAQTEDEEHAKLIVSALTRAVTEGWGR